MLQTSRGNKGFIFLEILIATALISVAFVTLLSLGFLSLNISPSIKKATQADSLAKEEVEATRSFRDGTTWSTNGLGTVLTGSSSPYFLVLNNNQWALQQGTETVGIFTRKVVFDKVSRDPVTNNIESTYNASHDDPDTRQITVTISWEDKIYQVVSYLTNWQKP